MARKPFRWMLLFVVVIPGCIFWRADPFYWTAPSDAKLLRVLGTHDAAFARLRDMAIEDSPITWRFRLTDLDDRLGQERRDAYTVLFAQQPPVIEVLTFKNSARFIFASGNGWDKGIEYLPSSPSNWGELTESLDDADQLPKGGLYLRPARSQWFLFLEKPD